MVHVESQVQVSGCGLEFLYEPGGGCIARTPERRKVRDLGGDFLEQLQPLSGEPIAIRQGEAGDVAFRARQV